MAFGAHRTSNYVRIQANAEDMLSHRNIESVLFRGKKISEQSDADKLETFAEQLIKEQQRRKSSSIPTVFIKQAAMTPRSSSATISTVTTAITSSSVDSD
ncbi:uncharacterized protein A4U43_C04F13920 [Asparagus officinalis]|uniref:Uncharacterized protein n=2 Tax=Asparagus officinalis TaxID=4686 RepID=A0A5P1F0Q1_ASPOF|nr:uncharacterized protein A4U43_C04F13920 [Asparagus officinalis]